MLLILAITFSILAITISYLKKISKKKNPLVYYNSELDKYYSLPPNSPGLYKQLVSAASEFLSFSEEINKQIEFIEPLYRDRLVSDEYYENLLDLQKSLEVERMVLESESGKEQLFKDASRVKSKTKTVHKVWEDQLFNNKRGVLESELRKRLIK